MTRTHTRHTSEPSAGETTGETAVETTGETNISATINVSAGKSLELTDMLLGHADTEASKKRRFDNGLKKKEAITEWNRSKRITSGALAAVQQYCLNGNVKDAVLLRIRDKEAKDNKKTTNAKMRKRDFMAKVQVAKAKMKEKVQLSMKDMSTMIQYKKRPNDSAVKKRRGELEEQWGWRQNNPSPPQSPDTGLVGDTVESGDDNEVLSIANSDADGLDDIGSRVDI